MHTEVLIPVQYEHVTGELFTPDSRINAVMLFCHGWTSKNAKYLKLAETLAKSGILSLAINLRGHGNSIYSLEKYTRQNHLDDLLASIDYLINLQPEKPVILLGKSYGGYLSAIASSLRRIDFLIISQPALYPDEDFDSPNAALIKGNPSIFRSTDESILTNRALKAISVFNNPLLIIESEHDEEVLDTPKLYIKASESNAKRLAITIKDTDHPLSKPQWLEAYYARIILWLRNQDLLI